MNRRINEDNKLVYIPAVLPSKGLYDKEVEGYFPSCWNKEKSIWYYPNILLSAYHGYDMEDIRKIMGIDEDVRILYDSGGYQAVTLGGDIDPKKVVELQNKNAHYGLILDRPPYEFGGSAQFSGTPSKEFFNKCLNKTIENSEIALKNKSEELELYGVIQGETWEQINDWYNEMNQLEIKLDKKFDRWALSPKPSSDMYKIAMFGVLVLEKKIKTPLHILQVSGLSGIIVSSYIRFLTKQLITIDSSSFSSTSRYGRVYDFDLKSFDIGSKIKDKDLNSWFCDCPICSKLNMNLNKLSKEGLYKFIDIHNLYQIVEKVKYFDFLVEFDFEMFLQRAKEASIKCYESILILKFYKENGLEKTKTKYKEIFGKSNIQTNQISLFKF